MNISGIKAVGVKKKMPGNIKEIKLWLDNPKSYNDMKLVKIDFLFPCEWTVLNIDDLKNIIRLWIKGEELRYPIDEGFKGRWLLFDELKKVFEEEAK